MKPRGFTLIELVITLAIVGLLASAAVPLASMALQREKESELRSALRELRGAIDAWREASSQGRIAMEADASGYPPNLQALVDGAEDAASPTHARLYFLRRVPRDPFFPDGNVPAADTWGLRSYASPPDDPQPGEDVYDVHSLAGGRGLDGVPLREW